MPANKGLLVSWSPPADASLVAGYQVLCLPRPTTASAAGYESCGLVSNSEATVITPDDETQLCSAVLSAKASSVRVTGLSNGTAYTVAVIAINPSGATSAPSSSAVGTPQPTISFGTSTSRRAARRPAAHFPTGGARGRRDRSPVRPSQPCSCWSFPIGAASARAVPAR